MIENVAKQLNSGAMRLHGAYLSQIRWRLLFDFDGLSVRIPSSQRISALWRRRVFVDCEVRSMATPSPAFGQRTFGVQEDHRLEPDPASFAKLTKSSLLSG
jgi:hypothetical protein